MPSEQDFPIRNQAQRGGHCAG